MAYFLEERLPVCIKYGGSFSEKHAVGIAETVGGDEYRSLQHPFVKLSYDVSYEQPTKFIVEQILALYSRANGMFRGFRVKDHKDYTTNNYSAAPTALDQPMLLVTAGVYQLMRWYGSPSDPLCARRRLRKPVAGTVHVGVGGAIYPAAQWSVDITTGLVTFSANQTFPITGIAKGQTTVLTVPGHGLNVGQSIGVSGVSGMAQINGLRAVITEVNGSNVTVGINSAAFSDYSSGGVAQTQPMSGESVTGGCEFDIPCRFDNDLEAAFSNLNILDADGIEIVEILNP
jgi:uncharacterized protein (TIGR02217 family)